MYGIDRVRNAVHCTDLPEDGILEAIIMFPLVLSQKSILAIIKFNLAIKFNPVIKFNYLIFA